MKGYVDENNQAVFICTNCGFEKKFDAEPFRNRNKVVKIKCKCGRTTEMEIEFRKHFRKNVELFGTCFIKKIQKNCDIIIRDLSMQGLRLELLHIYGKFYSEIEINDVLELEFKLDTNKNDMITKRCVVRVKKDKYIGVEFQDDNFSKKLGFYLG